MSNAKLVQFRMNVSYLVQRHERETVSYLCFGCMSKVFWSYELLTLVGTWWGLFGFFLGPIYLVANIIEYTKASFAIARKRT